MSRTIRHVCDKLGNWEVMELYGQYRSGVTLGELARRYNMSGSTVRETVRRVEERARKMGVRA